MKRNKLGSIFLVSILALAGVGISYAGFTDEIFIYGTVNTATVDIVVVPWFSGTWVWKIWGFEIGPSEPDFLFTYASLENEILIYSGWSNSAPTDAQVQASR